jgi:hypothetical protein
MKSLNPISDALKISYSLHSSPKTKQCRKRKCMCIKKDIPRGVAQFSLSNVVGKSWKSSKNARIMND